MGDVKVDRVVAYGERILPFESSHLFLELLSDFGHSAILTATTLSIFNLAGTLHPNPIMSRYQMSPD